MFSDVILIYTVDIHFTIGLGGVSDNHMTEQGLFFNKKKKKMSGQGFCLSKRTLQMQTSMDSAYNSRCWEVKPELCLNTTPPPPELTLIGAFLLFINIVYSTTLILLMATAVICYEVQKHDMMHHITYYEEKKAGNIFCNIYATISYSSGSHLMGK